MRFLKMVPVFAFALAFSLGACAQQGEEGGEDLTPADTAQMEPEEQMEEGMEEMEEGMEDVEEAADEMREDAMDEGAMDDGAMDHDDEMTNP